MLEQILFILAGAIAVIFIATIPIRKSRPNNPSSCTGQCNQGRNCTCVPKEEVDK